MEQLGEHAVDTVGRLIDLFQAEDAVAEVGLVGGPQRGDQDGEVAPDETSGGLSRVEGPDREVWAGGENATCGFGTGQGAQEAFQCEAGDVGPGEVRAGHGTVKGDPVESGLQGTVQGGDVAVTDEDFGASADEAVIEQGQKAS